MKILFHHEAPAYLDQDYPITIEVTNGDVRDMDVVVNILLQPTEIDDAGMSDGLASCASSLMFSYSKLDCNRRYSIFKSHQGRTIGCTCTGCHNIQDSALI